MYRILNKQIIPALKLKQIMTSEIAVTDLRKATPTYGVFTIYISYTSRIYHILNKLSGY